jgi:predicted O-linked N-acetylglucosamine transferase (SPINDLY family)
MEAVTDTLQRALAAAFLQHQHGDLDGAEAGYRAALTLAPDHPYALNFLGLLEYQRGRHEAAERLARRALAQHAVEARFHLNLGNILKAQGRGTEAIAAYRRSIALEPSLPDAYVNLANLLRGANRSAEALEVLRAGGSACPENAVLTAELAEELGNARAAAGEHEPAVSEYRRALELDPVRSRGWYNLGNSLAALGRLADAVAAYRHALELEPSLVQAWVNRGNAEAQLKHTEEAAQAYRRALSLSPDHAVALCGLGAVLLELDEPVAAGASFEKAIVLDPASSRGYLGLGKVLHKAGSYVDAVLSFERALAFDQTLAEAWELKGGSLWEQGCVAEAIEAYERAAALEPSSATRVSHCAFARNYLPEYGAAELVEAHRRFAACLPGSSAPVAPAVRTGTRVKVGYVSADLRRHSVAYFFEPVLGRHDRSRFEVTCYFNSRRDDEVSARLRAAADRWVDCAELSDEELAQRVRADGIDLLVDLSGLTSGNRLGVFAGRAAPVQATWLGYPTGTGVAAIDYRITDTVVDPEEAAGMNSERPVRLRGSYFCYGAPDATPVPGPSGNEFVTFGSFNNLAKASPEVLRLWASVLEAVPGSRLLLKAKTLLDARTGEVVARRLGEHGIPRERASLVGWRENTGSHLETYRQVDIALDTYPYNGATTTCEALWMGVPVVSLSGATHPSKMGASILRAAGLAELSTASAASYVETAVDLARDSQRLARLREGMRERLLASQLMDAAAFTADLESAYLRMLKGEA